RALGHRVRLRMHICIDTRDDLFGFARAFTNSRQDIRFTFETMRDVLFNLCARVANRGAMRAEEDGQMRERAQAFERVEIISHIAFGRIYQNRTDADDVVARHKRARPLLVETEMPARVTRRVQSA